ncbi:recombinase family protein [Anaerobacillus sp. CMMVII]|uniref:recombinase family protein n=1 Tax=Anaerobacillus sp. CMMVII TaxID=2755588 RepID=UPI0021B6FCE4|nr:recombinase family protein [Anaerobacillus sp. CMMVII]MCT8138592.1 recombinase family protein [Anaerobacillus sp. CMMVII]
MRCAIYIRVSTKLQEDRFSLGAQSSELNTYAVKQGWNIIGQYKDVESGGKLNKQGLNQLLDLVEDGAIDVVLVIDQDRLSV